VIGMTKKSGLFGLVIFLGSSLLILTFLKEGRTDKQAANFSQSEEPKPKVLVQAQNDAIAVVSSEPIPKIVFRGLMHDANHPEKSVALLRVAGIGTSPFRVKEKVAEGYEVVSIEPERVVITNFVTGKTFQLQLTFDPSSQLGATSEKVSASTSQPVASNPVLPGFVKSENLPKPLDEETAKANNAAFLAAIQAAKK
jgi:hypothetical protein